MLELIEKENRAALTEQGIREAKKAAINAKVNSAKARLKKIEASLKDMHARGQILNKRAQLELLKEIPQLHGSQFKDGEALSMLETVAPDAANKLKADVIVIKRKEAPSELRPAGLASIR